MILPVAFEIAYDIILPQDARVRRRAVGNSPRGGGCAVSGVVGVAAHGAVRRVVQWGAWSACAVSGRFAGRRVGAVVERRMVRMRRAMGRSERWERGTRRGGDGARDGARRPVGRGERWGTAIVAWRAVLGSWARAECARWGGGWSGVGPGRDAVAWCGAGGWRHARRAAIRGTGAAGHAMGRRAVGTRAVRQARPTGINVIAFGTANPR